MNKLIISNSAKQDIQDALSYIKYTLCNPKAATNLADLITEKFELLLEQPQIGSLVSDSFLCECGIRSLLIKNYRAFYTISETENSTTINIIRLLYAKRDFEIILKNDLL